LRVYFTPLPRPGFALQGFPLQHSRTTSSVAGALSPVDEGRLLQLPAAPASLAPPSGLSSVPESVADAPVLPVALPAPLLGFLLLQVFPLQTVESTFMPSSAHDLGEDSVSPLRRPTACCRSGARLASLEVADLLEVSACRACRVAPARCDEARSLVGGSTPFDYHMIL
jgi:hypothetical protein